MVEGKCKSVFDGEGAIYVDGHYLCDFKEMEKAVVLTRPEYDLGHNQDSLKTKKN